MTEKDIFDLNDLSDLNPETIKHIQKRKAILHVKQILELFEIKTPLTTDEITVGLERKFNKITFRKILATRLSQMKKKGYIKRVDLATYEAIKTNQED